MYYLQDESCTCSCQPQSNLRENELNEKKAEKRYNFQPDHMQQTTPKPKSMNKSPRGFHTNVKPPKVRGSLIEYSIAAQTLTRKGFHGISP